MEELFGRVLRAVIPFIIPAVLIISWMMNHKRSERSGSIAQGSSAKKVAAPKRTDQLQNKTPVEPNAVEAPNADGVIADLADKAEEGPKTEDPYSI